jgi:hypothetical protein
VPKVQVISLRQELSGQNLGAQVVVFFPTREIGPELQEIYAEHDGPSLSIIRATDRALQRSGGAR